MQVNGKKTYAIAVLIGVGASLLWLGGAATDKEALLGVLQAFGLAALRHAVARIPADQQKLIERAIELYRSAGSRLPTPPLRTDQSASVPSDGVLSQIHSAVLLALLITANVTAGEVAITGPTSVPAPGFPCTLFLEGELPEGTDVGWTVTPTNEQIKQIQPSDDGISARLTTLAGTWHVCAAVHEPGRRIYFRFYTVQVPGTPYTPPPGPSPNPPPSPAPVPPPSPSPPSPGPTPPVPEPVSNRFGLRTKAAETVRSITSPNRAAETACLANGLKAIAEQIRLGTLKDVQPIVDAIGGALDRCTSEAWDNSRESLSAFIHALMLSGQLATSEDWRQAVREAEAGLRDML